MKKFYTRGMSLVDVIVGTALLLIIFMALFGVFRASIALTAVAKARSGATALATEQMEYIRSVTYANTGTIGGIPSGVIDPEFETTLNGREYTTRTFIQYIDDPADGLDGLDDTGIITDYKKIKIEVSYLLNENIRNVSLVSNRTPLGIEAPESGGNLRIQVMDAAGEPVSSAQVHIQNPNTNPTVDLNAFTGATGFVFLPGAATSTGYHITVSKNGYSTTETYDQDAENINPNPGHLTVVEAETTQGTFPIDILSTLRIETWQKIRAAFTEDVFTNEANLSVTNMTEVVSGELVLTNTLGVFDTVGAARSISINPTYLSAWDLFQATTTKPAGTTITYQFLYDNLGTPTLLPEEALIGNAAGFTSSTIDLSSVSADVYSALYVEASLETNDTASTPSISEWQFTYDEGPVPMPDVPFTLTGSKSIGENGSGDDIKKYSVSATTGPAAWTELSNIEWDGYSLQIQGYDVEELCDPDNLSVNPNTANTISAYLKSNSAYSLRTTVRTEGGGFVDGATVSLTRTGYSQNESTGTCGQTYFGSLGDHSDYAVSVSKAGYVTEEIVDVSVSGDAELLVLLTTS